MAGIMKPIGIENPKQVYLSLGNKISIYKQSFYPGDQILGTFDFSHSDLPCYQISACLVRQEIASSLSLFIKKVLDTKVVATDHVYTQVRKIIMSNEP